MIKNLNTLKKELRELAGVINAFKSEAVQLRLLELAFGEEEGSAAQEPKKRATPKRTRRSSRSNAAKKATAKKSRTRTRTKGKAAKPRQKAKQAKTGLGGSAMATKLFKEGFFAKPKTLRQILEHCEKTTGMKFKPSDFSGPLLRMTRAKKLKRSQNAAGQFEYSQS
ncbi:MAG TPA: hypothetical protein VNK07_00100 [Candidatus Binatia bacterium]|nr:hypothetical protein [Candidatus Binatia bacterium]